MSKVIITPAKALLTAGQSVTFEATNADGQPLAVNWSLHPGDGPGNSGNGELIPSVAGAQAPAATYIAPSVVPRPQTVSVVGGTANGSANALIELTTISIVPSKTDLTSGQTQKFVAVGVTVGGTDPARNEQVSWTVNPPIGTIDQGTCVYTAPRDIAESTTVNIIATTSTPGMHATAMVSLTSPPWRGFGVNILGAYILLIFSFVAVMVGLWPPALPSPDAAKANRIEAERTLQDKTAVLEQAEAAVVAARPRLDKSKQPPATGNTGAAKVNDGSTSLETANAKALAADEALGRARDAWEDAKRDLTKKRADEEKVNDPNVETKLAGHINRELDLLCLVLLAGSLGSFLHMAQSYSDFIGNRTIKSSWAWWYSLRPFIGAGLAMVFYCTVRGGFMAIATGSTAKASELNPFGLVAVAALVGMFSKAATTKLGEVFDTLFKSDKAQESKDKLIPASQAVSQRPEKPAAGGSTTQPSAK